jgi:hypothetical protein
VQPRWISRFGAPLIAFVLTVAPSVSPVPAAEEARKVSVVSFGLLGDQGVFRSEATGAAQVVAGRFGSGPINVQYNSKKSGGATIEGLKSAFDQSGSGRAARLLMNCAQTAQRRRRDVKKRTNRSRHVLRGRNNEMNGPRRGLEFAQ